MMDIDPSQIKVALLAGGASGEREISLASGKGAAAALEEAGFPVELVDPSTQEGLQKLLTGEFDVAFLCLHGKGGEDGTMQGFLETIGLPYTGSGVMASAIAMDKSRAKMIYREAGLATPPAATLYRGDERNGSKLKSVEFPCVVKPANDGSAIGVFIVEDAVALKEALEKCFEIDHEIIVEKYVEGTEITAAVIGNDKPFALPVIEIIPTGEFYDFDSKYAPGGSRHICPARLSDDLTSTIQELAVLAHKALGCRGMSRTDMIIDKDNQAWILETNTIPGMTGTSLLPDAANVAGITFPELTKTLIELALE